MLEPRRYTDERTTVVVYDLHNAGKPVPEIARRLGMLESEVRRRIVDIWLEHKMRMHR